MEKTADRKRKAAGVGRRLATGAGPVAIARGFRAVRSTGVRAATLEAGSGRRTCEWSEIQAYFDAGHNAAETRRRFGLAKRIWDEAVREGRVDLRGRTGAQRLSATEFIERYAACGRTRGLIEALRRRLLAEHGGRCQLCGTDRWLGMPIVLEVMIHWPPVSEGDEAEPVLLCLNCEGLAQRHGLERLRGRPGAGTASDEARTSREDPPSTASDSAEDQARRSSDIS